MAKNSVVKLNRAKSTFYEFLFSLNTEKWLNKGNKTVSRLFIVLTPVSEGDLADVDELAAADGVLNLDDLESSVEKSETKQKSCGQSNKNNTHVVFERVVSKNRKQNNQIQFLLMNSP